MEQRDAVDIALPVQTAKSKQNQFYEWGIATSEKSLLRYRSPKKFTMRAARWSAKLLAQFTFLRKQLEAQTFTNATQ